eukprot:6418790-Alexandrium_andersonii.AAC.1
MVSQDPWRPNRGLPGRHPSSRSAFRARGGSLFEVWRLTTVSKTQFAVPRALFGDVRKRQTNELPG